MRIIAFIEDYKVIKKILDWLGIAQKRVLIKSIHCPEVMLIYCCVF